MIGQPVKRHPPQLTPVPLITAALLPVLKPVFEVGQTPAGVGDFLRLAAYGRKAREGEMEIFVDGVDHSNKNINNIRIKAATRPAK